MLRRFSEEYMEAMAISAGEKAEFLNRLGFHLEGKQQTYCDIYIYTLHNNLQYSIYIHIIHTLLYIYIYIYVYLVCMNMYLSCRLQAEREAEGDFIPLERVRRREI